ncbi:N-acetylglucosamine-6-phosphate deacetylase isoform X3 [Alligator sinensis]|uniref:N-acetylglucosamine-6-phosphate deacetylase n=1 Tax=Alligator sinensis TaxID=38654 RepID=A0A1U8DDE9_ALLSI|nr:N-acetylglucosamine-6-phosphate deacetylase isoform X3 [Alligator sinensis]
MPSNKSVSDAPIFQFTNCRILRNSQLQREDLWVREGKILNPEKLFFDEKGFADIQLDCKDSIIAPGFIDVQINGGFGVDFSLATDDFKSGINLVSQKILSHGVTSFCPTLVTSPPSVYHKVLPQISVRNGGAHGAGVLGAHLEGPFISREKKGAHPEHCLRTFESGAFQDLLATYGALDCIRIVTLAPEMKRSGEVIEELTKRGICVSLGHSVANLSQAEEAVQHGATFITHLFNAMLPFHHRDPGIVGLLTSDKIPTGRRVFYGMISDGIHTNPAALRIAHRAHPKGMVLVTDAIAGMGLAPGRHTLGQQVIEIDGLNTYIAGTKTLSGSVATMDTCVRHFLEATGCTVETALEAASLHPAQLLGIEHKKGTLDYDSDADFLMLDDSLHVQATYIAAEETQQILKVLRSHKAPFVKKRQVMNRVLGDYRFKMAEERKKAEKAGDTTESIAQDKTLRGSPSTGPALTLECSILPEPNIFQTMDSMDVKEGRDLPILETPRLETVSISETKAEKTAVDETSKKKKKKKKPSNNKKELEENEVSKKVKMGASRHQDSSAPPQDQTPQSDEQLRREVDWCVEQLELGLKMQKSTPKQVDEALRAIRTLHSDKAVLAKKRQVMRAMFGDYRKKMEEERQKQLKLMHTAAKSAKVTEVSESTRRKSSQVFRKHTGSSKKSLHPAESHSDPLSHTQSPRASDMDSFVFTTSQEEFCFNFF